MSEVERMNTKDIVDASIIRAPAGQQEKVGLKGTFYYKCIDKDGNVRWEDMNHNTVVFTGRNDMLDSALSTASALVGPFLGIIGATSFSAIATADTMATHGGWLEAGTAAELPTYTVPRPTLSFGAAANGAKTATTAAFAITSTGTVKGSFVVLGAGASSTVGSTSGVLFSAGLFSGGDKIVATGDTLQVVYSVTFS